MRTLVGEIEAVIEFPKEPRGVVLFAHGAGSYRDNPRTLAVSAMLLRQGFAAVRVDLLTEEEKREEAKTLHFRFNVSLLKERVGLITQWLLSYNKTKNLPLGYFGSSTGAAAMFAAAAKSPGAVKTIISRGGRPDLVEPLLPNIHIPALFMVGDKDNLILESTERSFQQIGSREKELKIIKNAGHMFEEPGATEEVARLSSRWFLVHLKSEKSKCA